jgi:CxxC motif-containing protein
MRTLCSSVAVIGGKEPLVSVRTDREIPLAQIPAVMQVIKHMRIQAPVSTGDEVARNPAETLCRIVATRSIEAHTMK